ncbi:MAG: type II toxin-antitoxin system HicB family antitoxin [Firmicutes bacterium]|nr:type II toxin-antitoxin system HicB family antitoxin [Bacillota bacterium]
MKYAYTAIFEAEDNGYVVSFPDLPGCITEGDSVEEAVYMARDALCLWLYNKEAEGENIPPASNPQFIAAPENAFASVVAVDTDDYRRYYDTRAVKKTLTIPAWLNARAEEAHAPYSQILQQGLKSYLGITE